jgi:hypothetical protein
MLAKLSDGYLVITSRLANFSANFEPLALDVLSTDARSGIPARFGQEAVAATQTDDNAKARVIATELDGLALALEQAGAYIAKHRLTFDAYLERWHSAQHDDVMKWFDETMNRL